MKKTCIFALLSCATKSSLVRKMCLFLVNDIIFCFISLLAFMYHEYYLALVLTHFLIQNVNILYLLTKNFITIHFAVSSMLLFLSWICLPVWSHQSRTLCSMPCLHQSGIILPAVPLWCLQMWEQLFVQCSCTLRLCVQQAWNHYWLQISCLLLW